MNKFVRAMAEKQKYKLPKNRITPYIPVTYSKAKTIKPPRKLLQESWKEHNYFITRSEDMA